MPAAKKSVAPVIDEAHERRIQWWRDGRFGMFIHWGLYAVHGRGEWAMNLDQIPLREYEKFAPQFQPKPRPMREWARLARDAGMKYMVMTAKHHEGFCLWDSKLTSFNSVKMGPKRDLVREYLEAAREFGLKAGLYYSLMDWRHPDGARCALNRAAYKRFIDFTHGCVRELMSNYGKVDILWYDLCWPFMKSRQWQSKRLNAMVRKLQGPDVLINDRSLEPEDYDTGSEGHIREVNRDWEACMTTNGSWGFQDTPEWQYMRPQQILGTLRAVTAGAGNLLLNVGPRADGSIPEPAVRSLEAVGRWLKVYGPEVVYGKVDKVNLRGGNGSSFTRKGKDYYCWITRWGNGEHIIGRFHGKVLSAELLPDGRKVKVEQTPTRLIIRGLPKECPSKDTGIGIVKMRLAAPPKQEFGIGCVILPFERKKQKPRKKAKK